MNSSVGVSMIEVRVARVAFALLLLFICTSCGETYRPVAFPIIPNPPNPGTAHFVLTVSGNGMNPQPSTTPPFSQPPAPGSTSRIDTSGDSILGVIDTGLGPVHATVLPNGTAWYAVNSFEDTVTASTISTSSKQTTIALPDMAGELAIPVFIQTAENGKVYVANYNYGTVSVINTAGNQVVANVGVDPTQSIPNPAAHPVTLAELPNGNKVYSANQGNGTVTSINTIDDSVGVVLTTVGSSPVWVVARSDSQRVYVLDKSSGNVSVVNPTTTPDTVLGSVATAAGADFMLYDGKLNRLYVLSSAGNALWAFDASANLPALLAAPISMVPLPETSANPCATSVAPVPVSLTALADGTRVYVASYQKDTSSGNVCSQVSVFSSTNYTPGNIISLGYAPIVTDIADYPTGCDAARPNASTAGAGFGQAPLGFRLSAASSADNKPTTRVYVANCDQGNTAVITTVAINSPGEVFQPDTLITQINSPLSAFLAPPPPLPVNGICPNTGQAPVNGVCPQPPPPTQNPLFIVASP
jgi:YVTN family beta-propeller protein